MNDASERLARASANLRWAALAAPDRDHIRDVFIDTLAVMVGGVSEAMHSELRERVLSGGGAGPATALGASGGISVGDAVMLNATLPTVLQLDEGYRASRGHPAIHIVPVALAVGEHLDASLGDVLSALAAGYEVAARIGIAMGGTIPAIHPHGNWGTVGAAVAAARLYAGAEAATIRTAIDIAAGVAGQHDRRAAAQGAGMHHLWASIGAHTGYLAGTAAASGATAVPHALSDFLLPRSAAAPQPELLIDGVENDSFSTLLILKNYFKFWAACAHTHTAIGATLGLLSREEIAPSDVVEVEVRTFRASATLDAIEVPNTLAARFSIPYVVAAALVEGKYDDASVAEERLPELAPLAARVRVVHDPERDGGYPGSGRPLLARVRLRDGSVHESEGLLSPGDAELPATAASLDEKAGRLFGSAFGEDRAAQILAWKNTATGDRPIRELAVLLRGTPL